MKITAFVNIQDYDKDGNLIKETGFKETNSLVANFAKWIATNFAQATIGGIVDTGGTTRNYTTYAGTGRVGAAAGTVTRGIVVGTGTTAVALTDNVLQTPIAHGTGAGQLSYGICNGPASWTVAGSDCYCTIDRAFTNSSGGDITIREIGLYVQWYTSYNMMIEHTIVNHTVTNGTGITVTYKFQVTV